MKTKMTKLYYPTDDKLLRFEVEVLDDKKAYGRKRFLIKPVAGTGEKWCNEESLIVK